MDFMIHKKINKDVQLRIKNYLQYVHTWEKGSFSPDLEKVIKLKNIYRKLQNILYQIYKK